MEPAEAMEALARTHQKAMNAVIDRGDSDIQRFYAGATVFLTGGSGFLGKLLIEKLFRSCNIKKIFVLMRGKKGKSIQERLQEILTDPVFDQLYVKQPLFAERIVSVEGDVAEIRLGIGDQDWSTLTQEVDTIFHMAATTRFDESLRLATLINVRGTREVLFLAKQCKNIRLCVHVSTAYCAATHDNIGKDVKEQFHPSPVSPDTMIRLAEDMDAARLDAITPQLINGWPNTYTFTKAISEEIVRLLSGELPLCVVRPPIVTCTYSEPTPGWVDMSCKYGASGIVAGIILGVLRVILCNKSARLCFMPADYVTNVTIAAGRDAIMNRDEGEKETKIYTISSTRCGVKMTTLSDIMKTEDSKKYASPKAIWYTFVMEINNKTLYWILFWLLHYIPAYIIDGACFLFRVKRPQGLPPFVKLYSKIEHLSSALSYFLKNEWIFHDDNVRSMYDKMSDQDKAIYEFDVTKINWKQLILTWGVGLRKNIIKDGLKDGDYAYKKQKVLRVVNYFLVLFICCVLFQILSLLYSSAFV